MVLETELGLELSLPEGAKTIRASDTAAGPSRNLTEVPCFRVKQTVERGTKYRWAEY